MLKLLCHILDCTPRYKISHESMHHVNIGLISVWSNIKDSYIDFVLEVKIWHWDSPNTYETVFLAIDYFCEINLSAAQTNNSLSLDFARESKERPKTCPDCELLC